MKERQTMRFFCAILVLAVAACGGNDADDQVKGAAQAVTATSTTTVPPTTTAVAGEDGCSRPLAAPGEYEGLNVIDSAEQPYWVVVPQGYDDIAPAPLYLHLASGSGDHDGFLAGWRPYLDDIPGLMVMVNTARGTSPEALLALVDQVSRDYCVDPNRVHVLGTSWSGGMAINLACEAPDRIASFVSALSGKVPSFGCDPARPIPSLSFTGDTDRRFVTQLVETWAGFNGCDPEPIVEDLGSGVARKTYQGCVADVLFYDIEGMGHAWPLHEAKGPAAEYVAEYAEVDYLDEAILFFSEHPLR